VYAPATNSNTFLTFCRTRVNELLTEFLYNHVLDYKM
jgi:hypothetical protein